MWIISSDHRKLFVSPCSNILIVGSLLEHNTNENIFKNLKDTLVTSLGSQNHHHHMHIRKSQIPALKSLLKEPSMRNADITRTHQYRATFE